MALIDMLTDISSFNYNKVGKKHGEYFSEDNATGFTTDRNTKDPTEFVEGSGNDFNFKNKVGYSRFLDTNQKGFTIDRVREGGTGLGNTEYIIGSGNDFNFTNSGQNFGGHIFFADTHATGFTPDKLHKDSSDYVGISDLKFDGKTSLYGDIDSNVLGKDDDYDGIRDVSAPKIKSKKDIVLYNVDYAKVSDAKSDVEPAINKGKIVPKESKEYVSKVPNKPQTPMFSEDHPYGAQPPYIELEDRGGDTDDQYIKFGGNDGLRGGVYPSNANQGVFGFDSPYIIKEIGDRYDSLDWAVDSAITILPFKIVRTAEDVIRIGKWNLTAKGIMWNANQFLLTNQGARQETKLFNPLGTLGSIVPHVHLPRHTDGTFTDFEEPDKYPDKITGTSTIFAHKLHQPLFGESGQRIPDDPTGLKQEALDRTDASFKGLGINYTNRMENLRFYRIEENKGPVPNLHPLTALGLGNKEFVDPTHHVKSMKGPDGGNILEKTEDGVTLEEKHGWMITKYSDLTKFNELKSTGQGHVVGVDRSLLNMEEMSADGEVIKIDEKQESGAVLISEVGKVKSPKRNKTLASDYNLGKGLISKGDKLYEVGVSNMLQVPYGGIFNKLKDSIENLPTDFIKFRIRDAVNGKWLIFPAHLGAITDTVSPEWTKEAYIGRPDEVHIYTKTSRTVAFDFKVAAFTKQEIPIIQEKMNYLMGLGYPTFKKIMPDDAEERPVSPYIYLTIGDMFNNTPGYFDSIAISTEENYTWEIDEGLQIPMMFNVSVNFVYIGKYLPHTLGKHYEVPHLTDTGVSTGNYGTFGTQDPRDESPTSDRPPIDTKQYDWSNGVVNTQGGA